MEWEKCIDEGVWESVRIGFRENGCGSGV